nr:restriction endonuclease [Acinetobacter indicus]
MTSYNSLFKLIPNLENFQNLDDASVWQLTKDFSLAMREHMISDYHRSIFEVDDFSISLIKTFNIDEILAYLTYTIRMDRFMDGLLDDHLKQNFVFTAIKQLQKLTETTEKFDLSDYVIRQLGKTKNKRYEAYVISRIIHLLNDFSLKFVTQQYVRRTDTQIALTDLYFPQLGIHIEVDEGHHFITRKNLNYSSHASDQPLYHLQQSENDAIREQDIINVTGHLILRINVFKGTDNQSITLDNIHAQIDDVVEKIKAKKKKMLIEGTFKPWEPEKEFLPQTYINLGYISLADNVIFKNQVDACNCFGYTYKGWQRGGVNHPHEPDTLIWFPRLYPNDKWINSISSDGLCITEKSTDEKITQLKINEWKNGKQKRIVFARVKDNLNSRAMYRFMGVFKLKSADLSTGAIWERISDSTPTYPPIKLM